MHICMNEEMFGVFPKCELKISTFKDLQVTTNKS